jgi:hypothetical protein
VLTAWEVDKALGEMAYSHPDIHALITAVDTIYCERLVFGTGLDTKYHQVTSQFNANCG